MKKSLLTAAVLLAVLAVGCKPTEKNYRSAYDIAQNKWQQQHQDPDNPEGLILDLDNYKRRILSNGDSVRFLREPLKVAYPDTAALQPYNVAVAQYKMPTNAIAQSKDLAQRGYASKVLQNGDNLYFVVAGSPSDFDACGEFIRAFERKNPSMNCVGLTGGRPVVLIPSQLRVEY